jgi:hypothetical protein
MELSNTEDKTDGACGRRAEMFEKFWREIPKKIANLEELSINGRMLECTLKLRDGR